MNSQDFGEIKCRICWAENEELDWNNLITNHSDLTYRECYYKYTQLESIEEDIFSNMICHNCSNCLEFVDDFISRAIEKNSMLHEMYLTGKNNKEKILSPTADSVSILVEEIEIKEEVFDEEDINLSKSENTFAQAKSNQRDKETRNANETNSETHQSNNFKLDERKLVRSENKAAQEIPKIVPVNQRDIEENIDTAKFTKLVRQLRKYYFELSNSSYKRRRKRNSDISLDKNSKQEKLNKSYCAKLPQLRSNKTSDKNIEKLESKSEVTANKMSENILFEKTKANKTGEKIFLCQYCSAEIKGWSKLMIHEAKHSEVRKRTETCDQCGVKFYNKMSLRIHEQTHDTNRKKKYKCEFCEKAFYNMGALNVHKRIHLGLMVKCQICSKEFYRNVELYKHMNSHSSNLINVAVKKRSRYFVRCKHCSKKILSTSYKSHRAAHLNQPLVKCSICNKEYFNRASCRHHIRTIHKKKPETVNDYVVLLKTDRLTHLYLQQNADIELDEIEV